VSIAMVLAALACAALAPVAGAAEAPAEEGGGVALELNPRKNTEVFVEIHPELGVAVIYTAMGVPTGRPGQPWGEVAYAARIPKAPIDGRLELNVPGVLSIDGELTPSAGEHELEFNGSFSFTGKGGYLSFDATHAVGGTDSGSTAPCPRGCPGSNPSLFDYIEYGELLYTNHTTQFLVSNQHLGDRAVHFQAAHGKDVRVSDFEARTFEWLPGGIAVVRTIEVEGAPQSAFKVSSTSEHPKWAKLRPPAPFSGSGVYRNLGSIRSPYSGRLRGSLSVDLFGVKVRLAGPRVKAGLANLAPDF
jgi:hypothetical protein